MCFQECEFEIIQNMLEVFYSTEKVFLLFLIALTTLFGELMYLFVSS